MSFLIVQSNAVLSQVWKRHLMRLGQDADAVSKTEDAITQLGAKSYQVIILDLETDGHRALNVADYAGYRQPHARVLFVTASSFFSDGRLLRQYSNACGVLHKATQPEDLVAMAHHYAQAS